MDQPACQWRAERCVPFHTFNLDQPFVPLPLQSASHRAVLRFHGHEPAAGQLGLVAGAFQGQLPLAIELTCLGGDLVEGGHRDLELCGPHGFQEGTRDRRVNLITTHRLAGLARILSMDRVTLVRWYRTVFEITDGHPPPASSATDDPLEQGEAFAQSSAAILIWRRPVIIKPLLVLLEPVPGDVTGMMPGDEEGPVLGPGLACSAFDPRLLARQTQMTSLGTAIDIGAGVLGVVQDVQNTAMAQRHQNHLIVVATPPEPGGALEVMDSEVFDDGQG